MPTTKNPWSDRPPPPLPSYPPAADPDSPESGRWFLVSLAGRASMRIRDRFIVGSGTSCDLSLVEWGIAPHHALLTVEAGDLYIAPLSDAQTLVDGKPLRGQTRLDPDAALSFGELEFGIEFEPGDSAVKRRVPRDADATETLPPLEPVKAATAPPAASTAARSRTRTVGAAPVSLGIAVPLALFALWFFGADQWPARLAEYAAPAVEPPLAQAPAPATAQPAVSTQAPDATPDVPQPVAAQEPTQDAPADSSDIAPQMQVAAEPAPVEQLGAEVAPDVQRVAAAAPEPATDASTQRVVSELNSEARLPDAAAPVAALAAEAPVAETAPRPPPAEAVSAADTTSSDATSLADEPPMQSAQSEELVSQNSPVQAQAAESSGQEASIPDVSAPELPSQQVAIANAPHTRPGPPLIFNAPESAPLVDLTTVAAAQTRVEPPWSDLPPPPLPPPDRGSPLIFGAQEAALPIDMKALARADARVKTPWSGEPVFAVPRRDRGAAPIVDLAALTARDNRVKPPWSDAPALVAVAARAEDGRALQALLSEADRRYSQGDLVTPPHQSAAELYVKVLQIAPKSRTARTRLNNIVGWVALDASDLLADRRVENARQTLARLSVAVPNEQRAAVDPRAMRRWRVVELLLTADGLMQKRRIVGPATPNAVRTLREVLKIDQHNAIAEEMLARALGMLAAAPKR